jgi:hypothetical protein
LLTHPLPRLTNTSSGLEVVTLRVQKVLMPTTAAESWTLVNEDLEPVEPAEDYLAYLSAIERSPATVRAYAFGLKLWFEFTKSASSMIRAQRWLQQPPPWRRRTA